MNKPMDGGEVRMELYCTSCGYGISVVTVPERCPMCREAAWDFRAQRSLEQLARDLASDVPIGDSLADQLQEPAP